MPSTVSFSSSVNLLGSTAYPNSNSSSIWASNATPNAGTYTDCLPTDILTSFGIPISNPTFIPSGHLACTLPGYDINNMDALSALKLCMATFLKDGRLVDVFINEDGEAEFVEIYPGSKISLTTRMCIPTTLIDESAKLVIVSGYDPPPVRHIKAAEQVIPSSKDYGPMEPSEVPDHRCVVLTKGQVFSDIYDEVGTTCLGNMYESTAVVSYRDPVLQAKYKDGEDSLYEPTAFESIAGYIIDFDTGMGNNVDWGVSYQSSATTQVTYDIGFAGLTKTGTKCAVMQNSATYAKFIYESFKVDPVECEDRYDETWPLLLGVNSLEAVGHTIQEVNDYTAFLGTAASAGTNYHPVTVGVDERVTHVSVPAGKNWHWEYENGDVYIYLYSPTYDDGSLEDYVLTLLNYSNIGIYPYRSSTSIAPSTSSYSASPGSISAWAGHTWPNLGAGYGSMLYMVAATVTIDRPSIIIQDSKGEALKHAQNLTVSYYPLVIEDVPAPVAYCGDETGCDSVDHTLDIYDNDPSTVETRPVSKQGSMTWLQTKKTGHTIEISLPFLETESECEAVADFLYKLYKNFDYTGTNSMSYNVVCGPDDQPTLGARVDGYPEYLRINEISYSFSDGSAYTINVSLGPVWQGVGSWNNSVWQKKTEEVTREGIVVWGQGDGMTYRVRVRGMGEYYALNTQLASYVPGEKVQVRIYNNPVEE